MTTPLFDGILPPLTTPFDSTGEVDLDTLSRNLATYNQAGLAGYVAFGSNGEAAHLDSAERRAVLERLRRDAAPGHLLVAGVNALSTREAVRATAEAAEAGADAVLMITPYFYKGAMGPASLEVFFTTVADTSELPVLLYNVPKNTGVHLLPETIATLAPHPNIVGVKDSSGDLGSLAEILRQVPEDFQVLVGNAGILASALAMGARGAILAMACLHPGVCVAIHRAVAAGEWTTARRLQQQQAPVARWVTAKLGVPGLKAALDLAGLGGGDPRGPLLSLGHEDRGSLRQAMVESGLFPGLR